MIGTARRGADPDLPRIKELALTALDELSEVRGGTRLAVVLRGRGWPDPPGGPAVRSDQGSLFVGCVEGLVVGFAYVRVRPGGEDGARRGARRDPWGRGFLEVIYVTPEARGVGVGSAMISEVLSWCTERSLSDLDAMALPGDRVTKSLFESSGLKARLLVMSRALS